MAKKSCILCRKHHNDGIIIYGKVICKSCEDKLVNSVAGNDFYDYYKERIRRGVWEFTVRHNRKSCGIHS